MIRLSLAAALLSLCAAKGQAAQYLYQANAYTSYGGCGKEFLPFQMTLTFQKALPSNASNIQVLLKAIATNGGGKYQWKARYPKSDGYSGTFSTDSTGAIIQWNTDSAKTRYKYVSTINEPGEVDDSLNFYCGAAEVAGNPGTWTRIK